MQKLVDTLYFIDIIILNYIMIYYISLYTTSCIVTHLNLFETCATSKLYRFRISAIRACRDYSSLKGETDEKQTFDNKYIFHQSVPLNTERSFFKGPLLMAIRSHVSYKSYLLLGVLVKCKVLQINKCSARSMEVKLSALLENYDRLTEQPTDQSTDD